MLKVDTDNPSFKQINLVKVSRKAFKNPEDLKACEREFDIQLHKISGDKIGASKLAYYINEILAFLSLKKTKFSTHLEGRRFRAIEKSPEKDYHSVVVYTGEDQEKLRNILSKQNIRKQAKIIASEYTFDKYMEPFNNVIRFMTPADKELCFSKYMTEQIKLAFEYLSKQARNVFKDSKVNEFKINSFEEMRELKDKLG